MHLSSVLKRVAHREHCKIFINPFDMVQLLSDLQLLPEATVEVLSLLRGGLAGVLGFKAWESHLAVGILG